MPTVSPAVLFTETVVVLFVVAVKTVAECAAKVKPLPLTVTFPEIVIVVLVMPKTTAPGGMFGPDSTIPMARPFVLLTVTVVGLLEFVDPPVSVNAP